ELQQTFDRTVEEGTYRISRSWQSLLATGAVGGLDVAMGVFALVLVKSETKSEVLGALAFSIGFIALTLANSELFTENFLVAVVAAFLLAAGSLNHVIVVSIEMFAALQAHAPFGYADWAGMAAWAAFGNTIGGIGLVTILRLVQVTGEDSESRNRGRSRRRRG